MNMKFFSSRRFLALYSGGLTMALMVVLLSGFSTGSKKGKADFDEINVRRINIVEPDGTLRMTISNRAQFPGLIVKGKEFAHQRSGSGILFLNDEGTENGGLVFGGKKDANGKTSAGGSLTFDQYEQDQVVQLWQQEEDGRRQAGLVVNDQPDEPADYAADERFEKMTDGPAKKAEAEKREKHPWGPQRIFVGKNADHSALIVLRDRQGRKRILVQVAADGAPSLQFLDENGRIISQLPRQTKDR